VSDSETGVESFTRSGRRQRRVRIAALLAIGVVAVAAGVYGVRLWRYWDAHVATDDAFVEAHVSPVSARVRGTVLEVLVRDNAHVPAGKSLVRLDPRDAIPVVGESVSPAVIEQLTQAAETEMERQRAVARTAFEAACSGARVEVVEVPSGARTESTYGGDPRWEKILFSPDGKTVKADYLMRGQTRQRGYRADHDLTDFLPEIRVPVLVFAGEKDLFTPLHRSLEMVALLPDCELFVVAEGSHAAIVEHPETINLRIERFFAERVFPAQPVEAAASQAT